MASRSALTSASISTIYFVEATLASPFSAFATVVGPIKLCASSKNITCLGLSFGAFGFCRSISRIIVNKSKVRKFAASEPSDSSSITQLLLSHSSGVKVDPGTSKTFPISLVIREPILTCKQDFKLLFTSGA